MEGIDRERDNKDLAVILPMPLTLPLVPESSANPGNASPLPAHRAIEGSPLPP